MSLTDKIKTCIAAGVISAGLVGCGNDSANHQSGRTFEYQLPADCKRVINMQYVTMNRTAISYEDNEGKFVMKTYEGNLTNNGLECMQTYVWTQGPQNR